MSTTLSLTRGDTGKWSVVVTDLDSAVLDLSGCSLRMALWATKPAVSVSSDTDADLVLTSPSSGISITSAEDGEIEIAISAAQSAALTRPAYAFDLQVTTAASEVYTAASGLLTLSAQITHSS